ncbi:hypothetical protein [Spiroplasma endosymbiont of Ammophila pubescens]|uniref:hypothetical protein n=1 Tax=Spiroplasma endosymbiont of Ammophila pubescens TaxID=3066315 RepID=UPI0032B1C443
MVQPKKVGLAAVALAVNLTLIVLLTYSKSKNNSPYAITYVSLSAVYQILPIFFLFNFISLTKGIPNTILSEESNENKFTQPVLVCESKLLPSAHPS